MGAIKSESLGDFVGIRTIVAGTGIYPKPKSEVRRVAAVKAASPKPPLRPNPGILHPRQEGPLSRMGLGACYDRDGRNRAGSGRRKRNGGFMNIPDVHDHAQGRRINGSCTATPSGSKCRRFRVRMVSPWCWAVAAMMMSAKPGA